MTDSYQEYAYGWRTPFTHAFAITPDDSTPLPEVTRGIYVGGEGDIMLVLSDDGTSVSLNGVPAGTLLNVRVNIVKSTGTTATDLVGLY